MKVDRHKAVTLDFAGERHCFCSTHCLHEFEDDPERYARRARTPSEAPATSHAH